MLGVEYTALDISNIGFITIVRCAFLVGNRSRSSRSVDRMANAVLRLLGTRAC
jgi:hypothetical protein